MRPTMRLSIFAYQVGLIMTNPPIPGMTLSPCHGLDIDVRIEKSYHSDDPLWDRVYINGVNCGNREGGRDAFVQLVKMWQPEIEYT